jgi:hypothetical protein
MHYKLGGAYANVNMDYYHTFERLGEQKFSFNIRTVPVYGYPGKGMESWNKFGPADWAWSYGTGFRYPVFGSSWARQ